MPEEVGPAGDGLRETPRVEIDPISFDRNARSKSREQERENQISSLLAKKNDDERNKKIATSYWILAAILAVLFWLGLTKPVSGPEWLVVKLACIEPPASNYQAQIDCWLFEHFNRITSIPQPPHETCNDPSAHLVGNHRCCARGFHSNDLGATPTCYKD